MKSLKSLTELLTLAWTLIASRACCAFLQLLRYWLNSPWFVVSVFWTVKTTVKAAKILAIPSLLSASTHLHDYCLSSKYSLCLLLFYKCWLAALELIVFLLHHCKCQNQNRRISFLFYCMSGGGETWITGTLYNNDYCWNIQLFNTYFN